MRSSPISCLMFVFIWLHLIWIIASNIFLRAHKSRLFSMRFSIHFPFVFHSFSVAFLVPPPTTISTISHPFGPASPISLRFLSSFDSSGANAFDHLPTKMPIFCVLSDLSVFILADGLSSPYMPFFIAVLSVPSNQPSFRYWANSICRSTHWQSDHFNILTKFLSIPITFALYLIAPDSIRAYQLVLLYYVAFILSALSCCSALPCCNAFHNPLDRTDADPLIVCLFQLFEWSSNWYYRSLTQQSYILSTSLVVSCSLSSLL